MKKLLGAMFALSTIFIFTNSFAHSYKELTTDELVKMKKDDAKLVVIDSRSGDWFDGVVIEGATQLSTEDTTKENLAKLAPKRDQPVVFYCLNPQCIASEKAAEKAAHFGYTNTYHYADGIEGWKKAGLKTSKIEKKS